MRFEYFLYPEALKRIKDSGIEKRVQDFIASPEGSNYIESLFGVLFEDRALKEVERLFQTGYFEKMPPEFKSQHRNAIKLGLKKPKRFSWKIQRGEEEVEEKCDVEDIQLFSGEIASRILDKDELWD